MDPQVCLANARKFDPSAVLCPDSRCNSGGTSKYLNARCHCSPPYKQDPCPYSADSPVWIDNGTDAGCYCCCSCFAYGTPIAYAADASKPIEQFVVGETVMVATSDLKWVERAVEFSAGVQPSAEHGKTVIHIYYDLGTEHRSLVVTPDHVFFTPDKQLKRAKDLVPGVDQLVNAETGAPVAILGKETGGWWRGLHHIATTDDASKSPDYHLLNSNGVVTGDWALQVASLPELAEPRSAGLVSHAATRAATGRAALHHLAPNFDPAPLRQSGFVPFSLDSIRVPAGAQAFFSEAQAQELLQSGHVMPFDSVSLREPLAYVFRQLHYNYPNIFYDIVWEEDLPNVYSFIEHGVKFVVMTGGMARLDAMTMSGLYMVAASATGRLVGGEPFVPKSHHELSCMGQSDYFATLAVLRNMLFATDYRTHTFAGLESLRTIFGYLQQADALPGNRCNQISIGCRIEAFEAGRAMLQLPWCAGGPKIDYLGVKSTKVRAQGDAAVVMVTFDQDVNAESACEPENYGFRPGIPVDSVTMLPGSRDTVAVTTRMKPRVDYVLMLSQIISADGDTFKSDVVEVNVRLPEEAVAAGRN